MRNETQQEKGTNFLLWLEEERADAVAIHLDSLARRPKIPASQSTQKPAVGGGATDQSVFVATSAVQPQPPARIEVTTAAQGREVAAKRKAYLESKQLDKCPLCQAQHEYEKEWAQITPPVKVKMLSTLLTSCPKFLSQSPEQKMVTVTAQAACPSCTSWDHARHKFGGRELPEPKCKVDVGGSECGGCHGRWFHT